MNIKNTTISIKTDSQLKSDAIKRATELGIKLSEFGDNCLRKILHEDEIESKHKKEIEKLQKNISQLVETLKKQDAELEMAKKIMKNNEVLIETNKKLNVALKGFERKILELEKSIEKYKELFTIQLKEDVILENNFDEVKIGFFYSF